MKKFFDSFYIFSKFSISFVLLFSLLGVIYILLINYQEEDTSSKIKLASDKEIKDDIIKNTQLINKLISEIRLNKEVILEIKENTSQISQQSENDKIKNINENINLLNKNLNSLSLEIQDLKKQKSKTFTSENKNQKIIDKSKNDIIELILLKYENNISFEKEIEFLKNTMKNKDKSYFEKISVLSSEPFKGYEYLKSTFELEANKHLKKLVNKNPNSFFGKIITNFINVSPTTENRISNNLIQKIKDINLHIENKDLDIVLKKLKTIEDYENIFEISLLETKKYLEFKLQLYGLK